MTSIPNYSPGLEGVIGGISKISEVNSDLSRLVYYGYDAHDLAEKGSYEETAYLLLNGELPNAEQLADFKAQMSKERIVPQEIYDILLKLPKNVSPMDELRTAYSALAPFDPDYNNNSHDANLRKATRIIAKSSTLAANAYRIKIGKDIIQPDPNLSTAANLLFILNDGKKPDEYTEKVLNTSLTLYAEHGYNASAFAAMVTVSTLSDIYSGIVTGIGTLKGPLHGGANEEAMKMLLEVGSVENVEPWLRKALAEKRKIMGFGHREYKKADSRAGIMTQVAKEIGEYTGQTKWSEMAAKFQKIMLDEKGIYANVDFPSGYAYYSLGIPTELYTPIFVVARVAGWSAHIIEQLDNNRLIRPKCVYEGPAPRSYVPMSKRQ